MATTTIEARCNARPTRLAFVLPTPDRATLLKIIERATSLWGGRFNPILILDGAQQKVEGRHYSLLPRPPYVKQLVDVLRGFDPDLLISYGGAVLPEELKPWEHRTFPADNLEWNPVGRGARSFFVDVQPVLRDLWDKEFRNVAEPRMRFRFIPKDESELSLLLAARFGLYERAAHYEFITEHFKAEPITEAKLRTTPWPPAFHMPISITGLYCQSHRPSIHPHAGFLLDPNDPFDVIDYWNLRAAGMILLPLTMATYRDDKDIISAFGARSSYSLGTEDTMAITIIKGRSITDAQMEEVQAWIRDNGVTKSHVMAQGWVPEYDRQGYPANSEIDVEPIRGFESNAIGVLIDGYGRIDGPKPSFLDQNDYYSHWSMDWGLSTFLAPEACYKLPWLNPECDALVARKVGFDSGMKAAHVSKSGIVTRHGGDSSEIRLSPISAVQAVKAFLKGVGLRYRETSTPGLALARIIEMLGNLYECEIFQNEAIRKALEEMSTGETRTTKHIHSQVIHSLRYFKLYGQNISENQKKSRAERIIHRAIDANVFRVGLVFQCSTCNRSHWYSTTEFTKTYSCKECFSQEKTPYIHELEWQYSSDGLFRNGKNLDGNITILLALSFFQEIYHIDGLKYAPSFLYKIDDQEGEMDFAILGSESYRPGTDLIFGEAKTAAALKDDARAKLKAFGLKTKAFICFCTLADDFSAEDKEYFKDLHKAGIRIIMLSRFFLDMDREAVAEYRSHNPGRSATVADWLSRETIVKTLGEPFAKENYIWV